MSLPLAYKKQLNGSPIARLGVAFIAGMGVAYALTLPLVATAVLWLVLCITGLCFMFVQKKYAYKKEIAWLRGAYLFAFALVSGALLFTIHNPDRLAKRVDHIYKPSTHRYLTARITNIPARKTPRLQVKVLELIDSTGHKQTVAGNIFIYLPKDDAAALAHFSIGDEIVVPTQNIQKIQQFTYPENFDYVAFCARQNIYFSLRLPAQQIHILHAHTPNLWERFIDRARAYVLTSFDKSIVETKSAGFVKSLIMGRRDALDEEIKEAYRISGIMHVMAISGLHVGTLYIFLRFLLTRPRRFPRLLRFVVLIAVLLLYGLLATGGVSIWRSVIMFCVIALADLGARKNYLYNSLFLSAMLLLCYNPYYLLDVGFLLSYTAVLGIALWSRPIGNLFVLRSKFLRYIWQIIATTLAAQIACLPILIAFFYNFPSYFVFANLAAIPLVSALVPAAFFIVILYSLYPPLAQIVGTAIHYLIAVLNKFILNLSELPHASFTISHVTAVEIILYFALVGCLMFGCVQQKNKKTKRYYAGISLGLIMLLGASFLYDHWRVSRQEKLFLHRNNYVECISGERSVFIRLRGTQHTKKEDSLFREKAIQSARTHDLLQIEQDTSLAAYYYFPVQNTLLIRDVKNFLTARSLRLRTLIITHLDETKWQLIVDRFHFQQLVIMRRIYDDQLRERVMQVCAARGVRCIFSGDYNVLRLL